MKFPFAKYFDRRSVRLPGGFATVSDMLATDTTASGITVTPARALGVPAVYACCSVLSQDVAKTPIKLRQRIGPDSFTDAIDHDLFEILGSLPNPETSAYSFKHSMMFDLLLYEHAYAEIVRVDGRITALWRLDPTRMTVDRDDQRRKRYRYTRVDGQAHTWIFEASRPPILELVHPSPLRHCQDLIANAIAVQQFAGLYFRNGARLGGVLQTEGMLSEESVKRIRASFENWYGGLKNAHRFAVLESGLKYQQVAAPNTDSQMTETMQALSVAICGTFRIPPFKVSDLTRASYANTEALSIEYTTGTLDPYFTCWEEAIRRDCLTVRQYHDFAVTFDRSTLIRSDSKTQHEALSTGRQNGFYSANDIRRKLGENPIPAAAGGDTYLINGALVPMSTGMDEKTGSPAARGRTTTHKTIRYQQLDGVLRPVAIDEIAEN